jgi:hypothetical protein
MTRREARLVTKHLLGNVAEALDGRLKIHRCSIDGRRASCPVTIYGARETVRCVVRLSEVRDGWNVRIVGFEVGEPGENATTARR